MSKEKTGVVFNENDYAGMPSRIIIIILDLIMVSIVFVAGYSLDSYLYESYYTNSFANSLFISLFISYLYLTVIKASKIGTLGQLVTNTKIIHINGKKPNIFTMTYRLIFWVLGPINFVLDYAWLTLNKERRTIRDSICNTIIVKKDATPISRSSKIRGVRAMVFGFHFLYETAKP